MISSGNHKEYICTELGENQYLVLSAGEKLILGPGGDIEEARECTLYIYALNVGVTGCFQAGNVLCSCRNLVAAKGACIDVSGKEGTSENVECPLAGPAKAGGKGGDGGWIVLFTGDGLPEKNLKLIAHGGRGGAGQSGKKCPEGGKGGDGGKGGRIGVYTISPLAPAMERVRACLGTEKRPVFARDLFELSDDGAKALAAEILKKCLRQTAEAEARTPLTYEAWVEVLDSLLSRWDSAGFQKFIMDFIIAGYEWESTYLKDYVFCFCDASPGESGPAGEGIYTGAGGKRGAAGTLESRRCMSWKEMYSASKMRALHPQLCQMVYNKAVSLYMVESSPASQGHLNAYDLFNYLCSSLTDLGNRSGAPDETLTDKDCAVFQRIQDQAFLNLRRMRDGKSYYGEELNFVPRLSFDTYISGLTETLAHYQTSEIAWQILMEENTKKEDVLNALARSHQELEAAAIHTKDERNKAIDCMNWLSYELAQKQQKIDQKQESVQSSLLQCEDILKNASGYTVDDFVSAIGMLGFAPESKLIMGSQAVDFVNKSQNTLVNYNGTHIDKKYVMKKVAYCRSDWNGLKEGMKQMENGALSPTDEGAVKLLANKEEIENLLEQFCELIPYEELKENIEAYCKLVLERNTQIIKYNDYLVQTMECELKILEVQEQMQMDRDTFLKAYDAGAPEVFSAAQRCFQITRDNLLKALYRTDRALRYLALTRNSVMAEVFEGTPEESWDYSGFALAVELMKKCRVEALEKRSTPKQRFEGAGSIRWKFDRKDLDFFWEMLQKYGSFEVDIPPVNVAVTVAQSPFAGMSEVRITKARPQMRGITTANGELRIEVIQGGDDVFYSSDKLYKKPFEFTHAIVKQMFRCRSSEPREILQDIDYGQTEGKYSYALISPFSRWRVSLPKDFNQVEWEKCEKEKFDFQMEFWGDCGCF